jgi:phage terminase small subunit
VARDATRRKLRGARTRARHRDKGDLGIVAPACDPPPGLSRRERAFWQYYAPALAAERRLTIKARDVLAKYCSALAVVAGLRTALASRKRTDIALRANTRKELRQWLLAARLYENDLLLNPAASIRAPRPDVPPPLTPGSEDPFAEFEDDGAEVH